MDSLFQGAYDFVYELLDFIADILNICPFDEIIPVLEGMNTGLGWFNWFIPVSSCVNMVTVWAAALLLYYCMSFVIDRTKRISQ